MDKAEYTRRRAQIDADLSSFPITRDIMLRDLMAEYAATPPDPAVGVARRRQFLDLAFQAELAGLPRAEAEKKARIQQARLSNEPVPLEDMTVAELEAQLQSADDAEAVEFSAEALAAALEQDSVNSAAERAYNAAIAERDNLFTSLRRGGISVEAADALVEKAYGDTPANPVRFDFGFDHSGDDPALAGMSLKQMTDHITQNGNLPVAGDDHTDS